MRHTLVLLFTIAAVSTAAVKDDPLEEFIAGNRQFTADIYKENLKTNPTGNFLICPISVETILALALEGSKGETSRELIKGLRFPETKERTTLALKSVLPQIVSKQDGLQLLSANKMYVNDQFGINDDFKLKAKNVYLADSENIHFGDSVAAANSINQWVENRTEHKIKNLVEPSALSGDVQVVLLNSLYFKGLWVNPFDHLQTSKEKFYTPAEKTVEIDTMHTTDYFQYYENNDLKAKFLEMDYAGGDVTMTIVLPNKKNGLAELEGKLDEVLKPQPLVPEHVHVALPKFSIESQVKFVPILKNLGLEKAFLGGEADLSGIGGKKGDLFISDVIQKTVINITEAGTEAAASTAAIIDIRVGYESFANPLNFTAEHPFLFYLRQNNVIMFIGKIDEL